MCGVEIDYYTNTGIMDWGGMGWNWGIGRIRWDGREWGVWAFFMQAEGWMERKKERKKLLCLSGLREEVLSSFLVLLV